MEALFQFGGIERPIRIKYGYSSALLVPSFVITRLRSLPPSRAECAFRSIARGGAVMLRGG
jgi:hypothetical protein